uniref:Uncharacterized protein n=1 Tax=Anguilla anguilla TaxID=7936 RepID=A0A0E9UWN4_ANGAN
MCSELPIGTILSKKIAGMLI